MHYGIPNAYGLRYMSVKYISLYILECLSNAMTATQIPTYTNLCILQSHNTICKHLVSHNALKYRQLLDLFSQRAWRWPNKGRNMSPWQYTIFIVYKTKCCVIDWHILFICYNNPGWKTLNFSSERIILYLFTQFSRCFFSHFCQFPLF